MMRFDSLSTKENELRETTKKLIDLRKKSLPLIYGDYKLLEVSDSTIAYQRAYFGEIVIVILNKGSEPKSFKFKIEDRFETYGLFSNFGDNLNVNNNILEVTIPAYSFDVIN